MSAQMNGGPHDDAKTQLQREQAQRLQRFFLRVALIEGALLIAVVLIAFVLELVSPTVGMLLVMLVAILGGVLFATGYLSMRARNQREQDALARR